MTTIEYSPFKTEWGVSEPVEIHFSSPNGRLNYVLLATVGENGAVNYRLYTGGTHCYHWDSFVNGDRWDEVPRKATEGWQLRVLRWLLPKYRVTEML